jgi:hypothetical protein
MPAFSRSHSSSPTPQPRLPSCTHTHNAGTPEQLVAAHSDLTDPLEHAAAAALLRGASSGMRWVVVRLFADFLWPSHHSNLQRTGSYPPGRFRNLQHRSGIRNHPSEALYDDIYIYIQRKYEHLVSMPICLT